MKCLIAAILLALVSAASAQNNMQGDNADFLQKLPSSIREQCTRSLNADVAYETQLIQNLEKAQQQINDLQKQIADLKAKFENPK